MAGDEIPILFSTNAATVGKEIDQATRATNAAAMAADKNAAATTREAQALAKATVAARTKGAAESVALTNSTALAQKQKESVARAGKGAAFLGVGRAFGGAAAVLGGGAGIGSMVAMTAAMAGVGVAIGAIVTGVGMAIEKFTELPRALEASKAALEKLASDTGQRATALLGSVGSGARNLIGQGGGALELAKQFAPAAGGLDEAIKATEIAKRLFGANAALALENAKAGTQVAGGSFSGNVSSLEGSGLASLQSGAAGRGIVARARGVTVSAEEMAASQQRLQADPTMQALTRLGNAEGSLQVQDFGKQAEIMTELFKKINEQLGITVKSNDAQLKQDQAEADARRELMQRSALENPIAF